MTDTVNQTAPWSVDPDYIGDDVYNLTDVVTDYNDPDGNPYCVQINTGSQAMDGKIARRIVECVNACRGINPEAVGDLLAACEDSLLRFRRIADLINGGASADDIRDAHMLTDPSVLKAAIAKAKGAKS
jgi:hypothetical protein